MKNQIRNFKIRFWITFITGFLILFLGIYIDYIFEMNGHIDSEGYGQLHHPSITGSASIILGIIVLIVSVYCYKIFKEESSKITHI